MSLAKAMGRAQAFFSAHLGQKSTVVSAQPDGDGWVVLLESVVEEEYMRERAQRDLVAAYEVRLDRAYSVTAFERKEVRERGMPSSSL